MHQMCRNGPILHWSLAVPSEKVDIPVLFSWKLDPITPSHRSEDMLQRYTNVENIIVPNKGHNVALTDCGTQMMWNCHKISSDDMSMEIQIVINKDRCNFHTVAGHISPSVETRSIRAGATMIRVQKSKIVLYESGKRCEF